MKKILISRTDSIGDVVLTLPMIKAIKNIFPDAKVFFLGREYTRAVVNTCICNDGFIELNEFLNDATQINLTGFDVIVHVLPVSSIAKKAKQLNIKKRIGTTNRLYHWFTCNKLVRLSRKKSDLHEAQLNLKLLKPLGIHRTFSFEEIMELYGLKNVQPLKPSFQSLLDKSKYNLILHPKSQGNGKEWGLNNFIELIKQINKNRFKIFISGTEKERTLLQPLFDAVSTEVTDICGLMKLDQFISFINAANGLVASGTGPLHIAAALGKNTFGIFPSVRPIHPGRWAPIGKRVIVFEAGIEDIKSGNQNIINVSPVLVKEAIERSVI